MDISTTKSLSGPSTSLQAAFMGFVFFVGTPVDTQCWWPHYATKSCGSCLTIFWATCPWGACSLASPLSSPCSLPAVRAMCSLAAMFVLWRPSWTLRQVLQGKGTWGRQRLGTRDQAVGLGQALRKEFGGKEFGVLFFIGEQTRFNQ